MVPLAALALLGPFSFVHVEERYLIPVKLLGLLTPTLAIAWAEERSPSERRRTTTRAAAMAGPPAKSRDDVEPAPVGGRTRAH
jgi:hypothetical protein